MRIGLVVELRHLAVARGAIHRDRLAQRAVRLEPHSAGARLMRAALQFLQEPSAEAECFGLMSILPQQSAMASREIGAARRSAKVQRSIPSFV